MYHIIKPKGSGIHFEFELPWRYQSDVYEIQVEVTVVGGKETGLYRTELQPGLPEPIKEQLMSAEILKVLNHALPLVAQKYSGGQYF